MRSIRNRARRLALTLALPLLPASIAFGSDLTSPPPIRWDLAQINGLEVRSDTLGIRDRIRVVTLGPSGCTPISATLVTLNPESRAPSAVAIPIQGRAIEFEIEDVARTDARLEIECLERPARDGPSKAFTLALDPHPTAR